MDTLEEMRSLMKEHKDDFVSSVKAELASVNAESAKFLAELREFAQQQFEKNNDPLDAKRKMPKTTGDIEIDDWGWPPAAASSSTTGPRRVTFRPPVRRPAFGQPLHAQRQCATRAHLRTLTSISSVSNS